MKVFILKKKVFIALLIVFIIIIASCVTVSFVSKPTFSPKGQYKVVIDAGHGGIDGGSVGKTTNVKESELNLIFAKNLKNQLEKIDISCVLTRTDDNGLYDSSAKSLKKSDMLKRKKIIDDTCPNLVISIHMNSFPLSSAKGAQVYYKENNESGEKLARNIQSQLNSVVSINKKEKPGDFYLVTCTDLPAVLVECGFLSNKEEEYLLQDGNYQTKICGAIMSGVLSYLSST